MNNIVLNDQTKERLKSWRNQQLENEIGKKDEKN